MIEGDPWTFEQGLLLHHKLEAKEDPHTVALNSMDIWVEIYDFPTEMLSDGILQSIGNSLGKFVKTDSLNFNGN